MIFEVLYIPGAWEWAAFLPSTVGLNQPLVLLPKVKGISGHHPQCHSQKIRPYCCDCALLFEDIVQKILMYNKNKMIIARIF